jgi:hypothetical protein
LFNCHKTIFTCIIKVVKIMNTILHFTCWSTCTISKWISPLCLISNRNICKNSICSYCFPSTIIICRSIWCS